MTYRTKHAVECKCGHVGYIKVSENDQPYSAMWAKYSLEGLNGSIENFDESFGFTKDTVAKLYCPKCGQKIDYK